MIDLDALCAELNEALPAAGWPLPRPLRTFTARDGGRRASTVWYGPIRNIAAVALHINQRALRPIIIIYETERSTGQIEPHEATAAGIVATLGEFRWVVEGK